jgi:hypothetical protein
MGVGCCWWPQLFVEYCTFGNRVELAGGHPNTATARGTHWQGLCGGQKENSRANGFRLRSFKHAPATHWRAVVLSYTKGAELDTLSADARKRTRGPVWFSDKRRSPGRWMCLSSPGHWNPSMRSWMPRDAASRECWLRAFHPCQTKFLTEYVIMFWVITVVKHKRGLWFTAQPRPGEYRATRHSIPTMSERPPTKNKNLIHKKFTVI